MEFHHPPQPTTAAPYVSLQFSLENQPAKFSEWWQHWVSISHICPARHLQKNGKRARASPVLCRISVPLPPFKEHLQIIRPNYFVQ
jgi:hypothetical protein